MAGNNNNNSLLVLLCGLNTLEHIEFIVFAQYMSVSVMFTQQMITGQAQCAGNWVKSVQDMTGALRLCPFRINNIYFKLTPPSRT